MACLKAATSVGPAWTWRSAPQCLAGGHGCETVANSHYSHLAGVNVAVFGIVGYVLLVGAALAAGDIARIAGFGIALVGFGFSAYLTYRELFSIDAICQWCVASAVIMTLLAIVTTARLLMAPATGRRGAVPYIG